MRRTFYDGEKFVFQQMDKKVIEKIVDDEYVNISHMVLRKAMPCCSVIPNVLIFYIWQYSSVACINLVAKAVLPA